MDTVSLIISSPGIVSMAELEQLQPDGIRYVPSSILIETLDPAGVDQYWDGLDYVLKQVNMAHPDLVVQITVVASLGDAHQTPENLHALIAEAVDAPVIVGFSACIDSVRDQGLDKPLVISPYPEATLARLDQRLATAGLSATVTRAGPQMTSGAAVHQTAPEQVTETLTSILDGSLEAGTHDSVLLMGGGWPTLQCIDELEQRFGVPVITSNMALAWRIAQKLDTSFSEAAGVGSLLRPRVAS